MEIVRRDRLVPLTTDAALEIGERDPGPDGKPRLTVNARSKRAAVVLPATSRMLDDGGVKERVRLIRPATGETMARAELDASNWRRADEAGWRRVWDAEIAACRRTGTRASGSHRPPAAGLGPPAGRKHAGEAPDIG